MNNSEKFIMSLIEQGVFSVDDQGRIWRHKARYSRFNDYKPIKTRRAESINSGYCEIHLSYKGHKYRAKAHRIVWIYFHGDIDNNLTINHKNFVRTDNRSKNLELVTAKENIQHAADNLPWGAKPGEGHHNSKLTEQDVINLRNEFSSGNISMNKLAQKFEVSAGQIRRIVTGKRWKYLTGGKSLSTKYGAAKLTEDEVVEIREKYASGETIDNLITNYSISRTAITRIVKRESWKHI